MVRCNQKRHQVHVSHALIVHSSVSTYVSTFCGTCVSGQGSRLVLTVVCSGRPGSVRACVGLHERRIVCCVEEFTHCLAPYIDRTILLREAGFLFLVVPISRHLVTGFGGALFEEVAPGHRRPFLFCHLCALC